MQLKVKEVERVYNKLGMICNNGTHHKMAYFYYGDKLILKTRLSHGSGDARAGDKIRCDFKLNENDFKRLVDCPLKLNEYITILRRKGFI